MSLAAKVKNTVKCYDNLVHKSDFERILIVGTVRNVESIIFNEIKRCLKSFQDFRSIHFFLVESDSTDKTVEKLEELKLRVLNFNFASLGHLEKVIPDRINRLRYCRNEYVKYLRNLSSIEMPTYVAVLDLDGMNTALSRQSVISCFTRDGWDVVTSNQTFGYYDILALRHPSWNNYDWTEELSLRLKHFSHLSSAGAISRIRYYLKKNRLKHELVYSKMKRIPKRNSWIKVNSGFGGAAIYKSDVFIKFDYLKDSDAVEIDHVTLHRKIVNSGGVILINPMFINSHINTYNINKIFLVRVLRLLIWNFDFLHKSRTYQILKKIFHNFGKG
jgi:hypothetical protein